jgi:hypothetical protein
VRVTNNAGDFRRLYAAQPLHAGLVMSVSMIRPGLPANFGLAAVEGVR